MEKLALEQLTDLAKFVVEENYNHHNCDLVSTEIKKNTEQVYKEELNYFDNSEVFVAKNDSGNIEGTIRVTKWDEKVVLPIQKMFNINPHKFLCQSGSKPSFWHIGRFAIKKNCKDNNLFKKLMVCAISPICEQEHGIAFAECDRKLLRVMNLLGIKTEIIGDSIHYLGSETIPISMNCNGLKNFYRKHKHLVS